MARRHVVFVSSTKEDLSEHRERAIRAIQRLGMVPEAMEDFGPDDSIPVDVCEKRVRESTLFVGL